MFTVCLLTGTAVCPTPVQVEERAIVTVLVVDDEAPITSLLREVLEDEGHTVLVAHDGRPALNLARTYAPDVVLTDYMMPRMDGLELARTLLVDPPVPHLVIAIMSAARVPDLVLLTSVLVLRNPFEIDAVLALIVTSAGG